MTDDLQNLLDEIRRLKTKAIENGDNALARDLMARELQTEKACFQRKKELGQLRDKSILDQYAATYVSAVATAFQGCDDYEQRLDHFIALLERRTV